VTLSKKGNGKRQLEYAERTARTAIEQFEPYARGLDYGSFSDA
jgi:hypothetical protein